MVAFKLALLAAFTCLPVFASPFPHTKSGISVIVKRQSAFNLEEIPEPCQARCTAAVTLIAGVECDDSTCACVPKSATDLTSCMSCLVALFPEQGPDLQQILTSFSDQCTAAQAPIGPLVLASPSNAPLTPLAPVTPPAPVTPSSPVAPPAPVGRPPQDSQIRPEGGSVNLSAPPLAPTVSVGSAAPVSKTSVVVIGTLPASAASGSERNAARAMGATVMVLVLAASTLF